MFFAINYMLSVVIPVYNVSNFIDNCIQSILKQTFTEFEIILVNDGSTDDSFSKCKEYEKKYSFIKLYDKVNGGVSSARNIGLRYVSGEYVTFMDSDDEIKSDAFAILMKNIKEHDAEVCASIVIERDKKPIFISNIKKKIINGEEAINNIAINNFPISLWLYVYKRELLSGILLNEKIHHLEDLEFQLRVLKRANKIVINNHAINIYNNRDGSANNSGFNKKVASALQIINIVELMKKNNEITSNQMNLIIMRVVLTIASFLIKFNSYEKEYIKIITRMSRKIFLKIIFSRVDIRKKLYLFSLSINFKVTRNLYKLIRIEI
ncbi:MAG: glycosyltransferase [bacterium]